MLAGPDPRKRIVALNAPRGGMLRVLLLIVALVPPPAHALQTTFVPLGSTWTYRDDGSNQGTAWRAPAFNDLGWSSGPAQLGYGDGDEATTVGFGPNASAKYVTTYFRRAFTVANAASYSTLTLRLLRDDGAVVYLNGTEVFRTNLPSGAVTSATLASAAIGGADETTLVTAAIPAGLLVEGTNVLAVEMHQSGGTSTDLSFDLDLVGATSATAVLRGPYLQRGTPTSVVVRWRTNVATASRVRFGTTLASLDQVKDDAALVTNHSVTLTGLSPATTYYYAVGTPSETLAGGDAAHAFTSAPPAGIAVPTRIWVLGDSGTANASQLAVRNAFRTFNTNRPPALWLMLGDNAYNDGTDAQYQAALFDVYGAELRGSVLWPTLGNHDAVSADSLAQAGPYYDMFTLPAAGEAGGVPSGTEAYYAFDYGNVHFVCLDSQESSRSPTGPMFTWLQQDLATTTAEWVIAFWHHPPYSKGSHDSDTESQMREMRERALPILETSGADLVLTGHSHSYERSMFLVGHYGLSSTLAPSMILDGGDGRPAGDGAYEKAAGGGDHDGAVYVVAGSSGQVDSGPLNHPAMFVSFSQLGSVVLDVDGSTLDARFVSSTGQVNDSFRIVKTGADCGNGVREGAEECDGADLGGGVCAHVGCSGGVPVCTASCTLDYASCTACAVCDGDGRCEAGESCTTCSGDCPSTPAAACGNGVCEAGNGEDCLSCPADCRGKQDGKTTGRFCCGDGAGQNPLPCSNSTCTSSGFTCTSSPRTASCCGDGACTGSETSCTCAVDCGAPPASELAGTTCRDGSDNDCDAVADCADANCAADATCAAPPCRAVGSACTVAGDCCSGSCRKKVCR
jgi:hypothetical protein